MRIFFFVVLAFSFWSCSSTEKMPDVPVEAISPDPETQVTTETSDALKQMLAQGVQKALTEADTFSLPFPKRIQQVEKAVSNMGLQSAVDKFTVSLNEAAKKTLVQSRPVWIRVIENMKIHTPDAFLASDQATATAYLKRSQNKVLHEQFRHITETAIKKTEVLANWGQVAQAYNSLPIVTKVDLDLVGYVTEKVIDHVTARMGDEEMLIRTDETHRSTDLLKKVFKR